MQKILIAGVAAAIFCGAPALAADMPVKTPPRAAASPLFNWTGLYVGGVYTHLREETEHCFLTGPCDSRDPQNRLRGSFGGVTLGYNWQWTNWVFGAEGDWSW